MNTDRHVFDVAPQVDEQTYLAPYLDNFANELAMSGYTALTIATYRTSITHFGLWLYNQQITVAKINTSVITAFNTHRCICPGRRRVSTRSRRYTAPVRRFCHYLEHVGVITLTPPPKPVRSAELDDFCHWLHHHRGLSDRTIARHERLLLKVLPQLGDDPTHYQAAMIRAVVCHEAELYSPAQAKMVATTLRVYLRFLATQGRCRPGLAAAVPTVAHWQLSAQPRYLLADEVERVITGCDRQQPQGIRDRAILLLLARLGLRSGDIISLRLSDIDWTDSTLTVCGKARHTVRLPLSQEVGDALLSYLEQVRPAVALEAVFLCLQAPYRPFACSASIADIVRIALQRAGILNPPSHGAHLLRHSAATALLRAGVAPEMIAAVLRHRSVDMTAYYAKVDTDLLNPIAQPWPGEALC